MFGLVEIKPQPAAEAGELDGFGLHCVMCDDRWTASIRAHARNEAIDHTDWHESGACAMAANTIAAQADEIMKEYEK